MSNEEQMRAEFEASAIAMRYDLTKGHTQRYAYENTQSAWLLWQAATASKQREIDALQVPETAEEIRKFVGTDFCAINFGRHDEKPCESDTYVMTAHDLISAISNWRVFVLGEDA